MTTRKNSPHQPQPTSRTTAKKVAKKSAAIKPIAPQPTPKKSSSAAKKSATDTALVKPNLRAAARRPAKILLTGGTGFLGTQLVQTLLAQGEKNLRVLTTAAPAWLRDSGVEIVSGSLTDAAVVEQAVAGGVGAIYHLAGKVSREQADAHEMYAVHVAGTRLLCAAARARGQNYRAGFDQRHNRRYQRRREYPG